MPAFPELRWGWGQCQQCCSLWAHTTGDRWRHQPHTWIDSSCWRTLSNFSPNMRAPISPTSHCSSGMNLGLSLQKLRSRPCPWQSSGSDRAKMRPLVLFSAGSSHRNASLTAYQKGSGQHTLRKEVQVPILKKAPAPKILNPPRYTGTLPHKNSPPKPQKITVPYKLMELEEYK